jgi:hypothetical protein
MARGMNPTMSGHHPPAKHQKPPVHLCPLCPADSPGPIYGLTPFLTPFTLSRTPDTLASEEIQPVMEVAVEMRQRVTDQLAKILPTEFTNIPYAFKLAHQNAVADSSPSPTTLTDQTPR